jgi:DNA mismatch repair protein MutS
LFNRRYLASLFGVINKSKTTVGERLLRATLLRPSGDLATIEARLDVVEMLAKNPAGMDEIQDILSKVCLQQMVVSFTFCSL